MLEQIKSEPENIITLYYYSLTCLLVKKYKNGLEALKLINTVHKLNYEGKNFIIIDYYMAKSENVIPLALSLNKNTSVLD